MSTLQIVISEKATKEIYDICNEKTISTEEFISSAISTYMWIIHELERNNTIYSFNNSTGVKKLLQIDFE